MKKSLFPIAIFLLGLLAGCEKVTTPVAPEVKPEFSPLEKSVLQVSQAFGLRLFQELDRTTPGQNLFISPFSLSDALAMTANGAAGETRQAILNTLGVPDFSPDELNGIYSRLLQVLPAVDPKVTFLPANSLWYDPGALCPESGFCRNFTEILFCPGHRAGFPAIRSGGSHQRVGAGRHAGQNPQTTG
ncbi:MAG: hypothetical protein D6715_03505 [Calditrichaeota bacterium]|nr:MAG: hypothetical protein D6715_03505 [Calditrichota bacterium]